MARARTKTRSRALVATRKTLPARRPTGVSKAVHTKTQTALASTRKRASNLAAQLKAAPMASIAINSAAIQAGAVGPAVLRGATGIEGVGPVPIEWIFAGVEVGLGLYFREPAAIYAAGGSIAPWSARVFEDIAGTLADGGGWSEVVEDLKESMVTAG